MKRKNEKQNGNKPKRRRMEKLEGWGLNQELTEQVEVAGDIPEEGMEQEVQNTSDWVPETVVNVQKNFQTDISNWVKMNPEVEEENDLTEGRKVEMK